MKNLILLNFGLLLILIGSANSECCDRCDNTAHCPNGDACGVPQIQCCSYGACNIFCCNCGGSCRKEYSSRRYSSTSPNRTASTIINGLFLTFLTLNNSEFQLKMHFSLYFLTQTYNYMYEIRGFQFSIFPMLI